MRQLPHALFLAAMAGTVAFVLATTPALPDRVATHFGPGGVADGWMTRDGYRLYMLAFAIGFVGFIVAMVGVLPRLFPAAVNVPNRAYWLAPERRTASAAYLLAHACLLGVLLEAMIAGVHALLLEANAASPPRLATGAFLALLAAFLALVLVWIVALLRRFRRPR
jgi:serine/threonine-protein kinase